MSDKTKNLNIDVDKINRLAMVIHDFCTEHNVSQLERIAITQCMFCSEILQAVDSQIECGIPQRFNTFLASKIGQIFIDLTEYGIKKSKQG